MADSDKASKTEDPTPRRMNQAHSKGQFARSEDIGVAFIMIASTLVILFYAGPLAQEVAQMAIQVFSNLDSYYITQERAVDALGSMLYLMLGVMFPFFLAMSLAAVLAGGLQSKFRLTLKAAEPSAEKLNPVNGWKRIFSLKSVVNTGFDLLKMIAVGIIVYGAVIQMISDPIFTSIVPVQHILEFMFKSCMLMLVRVIFAMAVIAAAHYLYMKWQTHQDLKMTKQEVKDERKQQEGDPHLKQAQRRMAMRLAQKQMLSAVPTSDVVVTNPTHYAVALRYERGKDAAPIVVAKGENLFAQRIKALAREHEVPMVENRPLARLLNRVCKVGETIPEEVYQVVADLLAYVYKKHRYYFHRLKQRRAALQT